MESMATQPLCKRVDIGNFYFEFSYSRRLLLLLVLTMEQSFIGAWLQMRASRAIPYRIQSCEGENSLGIIDSPSSRKLKIYQIVLCLFTKLQSLVENMIINHLNSLKSTFSLSFAFSTFTKGTTPRRFLNRQPKRERLFSKEEKLIEYNPIQALALLRLHTFTTFKESVQICVRLNVNPKNGEQIVRGTANLPAGLGKKVRIAVLCSNNEFEDLKQAGVDVDFHLKESAIKELQKGTIQFQKLYTTPSHLPKLKHYGKFLGPKGLMPNIKLGTLVPLEELPSALIMAKQGQVSFRVDNGKNIHAQIGKVDFTDEQLLQNWRAVMQALVDRRPPTLKGKYFTEAWVKSTMGPSWKINLFDIDPRIQKSIWRFLDQQKLSTSKEQTA